MHVVGEIRHSIELAWRMEEACFFVDFVDFMNEMNKRNTKGINIINH